MAGAVGVATGRREQVESAISSLLLFHYFNFLGKSEGDAGSAKRSEEWKNAVAWKLKSVCSVTNGWLAEKLLMGVPHSVSNLCGIYDRERRAMRRFGKRLSKI